MASMSIPQPHNGWYTVENLDGCMPYKKPSPPADLNEIRTRHPFEPASREHNRLAGELERICKFGRCGPVVWAFPEHLVLVGDLPIYSWCGRRPGSRRGPWWQDLIYRVVRGGRIPAAVAEPYFGYVDRQEELDKVRLMFGG